MAQLNTQPTELRRRPAPGQALSAPTDVLGALRSMLPDNTALNLMTFDTPPSVEATVKTANTGSKASCTTVGCVAARGFPVHGYAWTGVMQQWTRTRTAGGRTAKAPPADLLLRASAGGAGDLAEQVQRAVGDGSGTFATVTLVGFSLEGGALWQAMALVQGVSHLRLVRCWGLHGDRVAAVLRDSELSRLTVDSCDSPQIWGCWASWTGGRSW